MRLRDARLTFILCCTILTNTDVLANAVETNSADIVIRGGTIYDGTGASPYVADVAIVRDKIVAIGNLGSLIAATTLDARGLAVAPGFINMLSWATESLLVDGRSLGDIYQGVTLEVFGEGSSMGPLSPALKARLKAGQSDYSYSIAWTTLGEYLEHLEAQGVAPNVSSFVGASTIRAHVLGAADRAPNPVEIKKMQDLTDQAMREGALGIGSSLIYAPGFYAKTEELVALTAVVAQHGGMYISHIRSEGARLLEAVDELLEISRTTGARAEIYHLKIGGKENWHKYDDLIAKLNHARAEGLEVTANLYTYTAGSTGLDAAMPPWVQTGGYDAWRARLQDPEIRARLEKEMHSPTSQWENLLLSAGPEKTLLVGFQNPQLRKYTGQTLAEVARQKNKSAIATAIDLVIADGSRVQVVYFLMSETNLRKMIQIPWVSFGSDAASMSASGVFLNRSTHPRAYGNFARVLGKYTREEKLLTLAQAIHKLTGLPARNLRIQQRGLLKEGFFADVVVFDPNEVRDTATYEQPHSLAVGMKHVFVNGEPVLTQGKSTGRLPGRVVRGPGWSGKNKSTK